MIRIRRRLLASFAILTLVVALVPALTTGIVLRHRALDNLETDLAQQARGLAVALRGDAAGLGAATLAAPGTTAGRRLQDEVTRAGQAAAARITVIAGDGRVLADSEHDPSTMANHRDRPEVRVAQAGGEGHARRSSATLSTTLVYVAVPLDRADPRAGVIRLAVPSLRVDSLLRSTEWIPLLVALLALVPVLLLTYVVARSITGPIERLQTMACSVAGGDLSYRVGTLRRDELGRLGEALNDMADSLEQQLRELGDARDETEAIISTMRDGVLVLDRAGMVIRANLAASQLLNSPGPLTGRTLLHVARAFAASPVLQRAMTSTEPVVGEWEAPSGRVLGIQTEPLRSGPEGQAGSSGPETGYVLVVLRDETARRRVERVRRDFVANVSHELKTPLARLTLLASTLRHAVHEDPEKAEEFATSLAGEVDGLSARVDDLLTLSRVEEQEYRAEPLTELVDLALVVRQVTHSMQSLAEEQGRSIEVKSSGPAPVRGDRPLIETMIRNLVENAILYNRPGGHVWVTLDSIGGGASEQGTAKNERLAGSEGGTRAEGPVLTVRDDGVGISFPQQDRVFERFYRVDPAPGSGGTGLGLSIVRHVAERHAATVSLTSRPGEGSIFTVRFPPPAPALTADEEMST